jgi:putative SOS response-associated peptidase YedK
MEPIHDRMPVILPREEYGSWLDPTAKDVAQLLRPFPADAMTAYPVSTHVNNPKHDDPACVRPLPA